MWIPFELWGACVDEESTWKSPSYSLQPLSRPITSNPQTEATRSDAMSFCCQCLVANTDRWLALSNWQKTSNPSIVCILHAFVIHLRSYQFKKNLFANLTKRHTAWGRLNSTAPGVHIWWAAITTKPVVCVWKLFLCLFANRKYHWQNREFRSSIKLSGLYFHDPRKQIAVVTYYVDICTKV